MLPFAELSRIAASVARSAASDTRDDVYQEAWVKFLRYPPPHSAYAWRAAQSARNNLFKRERTQRRLVEAIIAGVPLGALPRLSTEERRRREREGSLRRYHQDIEESRAYQRSHYHRHLEKSRTQSRKRVRRFRERQAA